MLAAQDQHKILTFTAPTDTTPPRILRSPKGLTQEQADEYQSWRALGKAGGIKQPSMRIARQGGSKSAASSPAEAEVAESAPRPTLAEPDPLSAGSQTASEAALARSKRSEIEVPADTGARQPFDLQLDATRLGEGPTSLRPPRYTPPSLNASGFVRGEGFVTRVDPRLQDPERIRRLNWSFRTDVRAFRT